MAATDARGSAPAGPPEAVSRVVVVRSGALGDLVLGYPALVALKRRFPDAELTLIGRSWHAELLTGRPGPVDRVEVLPVPEILSGPVRPDAAGRVASWLDGQRARSYDVAVQLCGGGRYSNPLVRSLGAGFAVGLRAQDAPPLDVDLPYVRYQHETVRGLEVVGLLGAVAEPYPSIATTAADRAAAAHALSGRVRGRYVVLHAGASDPRRRWPPARFAAVADRLSAHGLSVVLTGTLAERDLTAEVAARAGAPVADLAGRLGLSALVGVLAGAELVVSNDTGPMHLADAVGTPSVGIYWCNDAVYTAPLLRARHRPLVSWTVHCPECGADATRELPPRRDGYPPCRHLASLVADVTVGEVVDAAEALLGRTAHSVAG